MKRIFFLLAVIFLSSSCSPSTSTPTPTLPPTAETPNPLPEPSDPTQLITVKTGEAFDIVLPANSSTGYRWDILPELDENMIQPAGRNYIAQQPVRPGSGGVEVWTFRAVAAGDTKITLGYYPPGNNAQPEETVVFSIQVE